MNDDELKKIWREREFTPPLNIPDTELVARMKQKMRKFDQTILWRDVRELIACAVAFVAFVPLLLISPSSLAGAGCIVVLLSCVWIAAKLFISRRKHASPAETVPMGDYLNAHIAKVKYQAQLLRSVWSWYLLPLFIGIELFQLGLPLGLDRQLISLAVNLAVFGFVYWLNLYAARKTLLPLQQELEHALDPINAPAPESEYKTCGLHLRLKLGKFEIGLPEECPQLMRFCIAMNCFWVTLPCAMLKSTTLPRETFPSLTAQAVIIVLAVLMFVAALKSSRLSRKKLFVLGVASLAGLYALAWGFNILRALLT
jgi:hypothetical protein